ncbi:MAG: copper chaperone PCu(A)C [Ilumatobacter sp.]|uniref:copper chaperone PCu(A)C n=1 Tax=Ilumatobacter sp. TaxID=1967498 RepID=UPI003C710B11
MNAGTIRKLTAPLVAAALAVGAAACGSSDDAADAGSGDATEQPASGDVTVADAWVREPAAGQTLAAGYGTITNGSDEDITLIGASAPIAATFEIHETSMSDDGNMSMSEKQGGFEIAAGESFTLEPGGPHVMMSDIDPAGFDGPIDLTFVFDSTEVTTSAELRAIGDAMEGMETEDGES